MAAADSTTTAAIATTQSMAPTAPAASVPVERNSDLAPTVWADTVFDDSVAAGTGIAPGANAAVVVDTTEEVSDPGACLVAWATAHGARVSPKVAFLQPAPGGDRRCAAREALEEDELLVELPRRLAFEALPPPAPPPLGMSPQLIAVVRRLVSQPTLEHAARGIVVALLVHHERMRGEASEFVDYLDTLPTGFPTMPILDDKPPWLQGTTAPEEGFIADEPWLYHGTGVEKLAQAGPPLSGVEGVSRMGRLIDELDPQGLHWHKAQRGNDSALRWAAAAVQSRAHSSRNSGTALVPLADSFNHSPSHANVELIELDSSFQIRALRKVKPDEELFLSYGNFSSAELLFNGGFACQANQHNCIIITRAELVAAAGKRWQARGLAPPTDIDLEARCTCLAEMGLPGPHGPRLRLAAPLLGGAVPAGLVSLVCGLLLSSRAWRRHVLGEREGERPTCEKDVEGNKGDFGAEGGDGGPGALHDLWAMASFLGAESADTCPQDSSSSEVDGEVLRHEVLLTLTELLVTLRHVRYGNSSEADAAMLRSAEQAQEHAEAAGKYAEAIASQRRVNILRVRVGELAVLTQLEATVRARSAAFSAKQLLATSPDAASSAPRSLAVSPAKRQRVDDVAEMA